MGVFLVENGVEEAVCFLRIFGDVGASGVTISVMGSWVDMVLEVKVGHVEPPSGRLGLFVGVGARRYVKGVCPTCSEDGDSSGLVRVGFVKA